MTKNQYHEIQHLSTKYCNRIIQSPKILYYFIENIINLKNMIYTKTILNVKNSIIKSGLDKKSLIKKYFQQKSKIFSKNQKIFSKIPVMC